jgi:hypothetical protein
VQSLALMLDPHWAAQLERLLVLEKERGVDTWCRLECEVCWNHISGPVGGSPEHSRHTCWFAAGRRNGRTRCGHR